MFSLSCVIFCFGLLADQTSGLLELPQVDDNSILTTEAVIRGTINTLFFKLGLRDIKTKPRLKEYAAVHKSLVAFTLQDYTTLKEIARLTRVDKTKIKNETGGFMAVINELLNEDVVEERTEPSVTDGSEANDETVVKYIDQFLTRLESMKEQYGVTNEKFHIKDDVYQVVKDKAVLSFNLTDRYDSDLEENDTLIQESNYWKIDESSRRIYRGDRKKIKYFPFMASIQMFNRFHCGGSIIKSDLVITASSCLQLAWNNRFFRENPAFLSVRVGSNFYNGGGENIPILEVYFHPEYNPKNLWNNICLLRLVRRLRFRKTTRKIKKIDFDRHASALPYTTDGITIVGWGARGVSNIVRNPWENSLSYAVLDMYPLRECQDIYSRAYVTHKHFCAGFFSKGGGACNRDVGGPGIVNGILTGVISFGSPVCGAPDAPTVFTKVGYYTDWIETIMEQDVPSARKLTTLKEKPIPITLGQYYRPVETTTFKLQPLSGKLKAIPINEVDALRVLQDGNMFNEFLITMFTDEEAANYKDILQDGQDIQIKNEPTLRKPSKMQEEDTQVTTGAPSPLSTVIGDVEPETLLTSDYKTENREDRAAAAGDITIGLEKNKELESDLANLIGDLDLRQLVDGVQNVEEDKLVDQDKIMNILKPKDVSDKISQLDESVLTLLYLSDTDKVGNENNVAMDYEDGYDGHGDGLSIPADNLRAQEYVTPQQSQTYYLN